MRRGISLSSTHEGSSPSWVRAQVEELLAECDIDVDGPRPWDIQVRHEGFYSRVLSQGSLGLGESYMDGWWEVRELDSFLYRLLAANLAERVQSWRDAVAWLTAAVVNLQRRARAAEVAERHYDLGNEFYECMLDSRMMYSCAYWQPGAATLDDAQLAKLDLTLGKLDLLPGQRVLDVGCGWGGALRFAAEKFAVRGVGITISGEQAEYARQRCAGMPIEIRVQDYRELDLEDGAFDRAWSIGMFEHVGKKNYRRYMQVVRHVLRPDARFLLHTIGNFKSVNHTDPWIHRYIFPNSMIPSRPQIDHAIRGIFRIAGFQSIGAHYERTLLAWRANFERAWPRLATRFDERFRRMWQYYLSASAAAFRARKLDVWQFLLEPI